MWQFYLSTQRASCGNDITLVLCGISWADLEPVRFQLSRGWELEKAWDCREFQVIGGQDRLDPRSLNLAHSVLKSHHELTVNCIPHHFFLTTHYRHFHIICICRYMCRLKIFTL